MNWDQISGNWQQFKGEVKEKWGKLTDDDLSIIAGRRDQIAGKLQERYGYAKERAERELDEFANSLALSRPTRQLSTLPFRGAMMATARFRLP